MVFSFPFALITVLGAVECKLTYHRASTEPRDRSPSMEEDDDSCQDFTGIHVHFVLLNVSFKMQQVLHHFVS